MTTVAAWRAGAGIPATSHARPPLQVSSPPGSQLMQLHARQRPGLVSLPGNGGCPTLFTGASTDPVSQYYSSFTMAQATAGC